ncbi:hypothetical protein Vretimale_4293 [Volvox reticuliferus]|uniref:Uncharacterized protein n=1 Tax=Volvox reticuliferus TaxID=1737510 RepID=A0A8J4DBL4_9CHLO|nr:hypothetical protein Vretimale_4293 [Volvox reticuliferus]
MRLHVLHAQRSQYQPLRHCVPVSAAPALRIVPRRSVTQQRPHMRQHGHEGPRFQSYVLVAREHVVASSQGSTARRAARLCLVVAGVTLLGILYIVDEGADRVAWAHGGKGKAENAGTAAEAQ